MTGRCFIGILLLIQTVTARSYYDFNTQCREAYHNVISARLPLAEKQLHQLHNAQPGNLITVFLTDYAAFIRLFLLENENDYRKYLRTNNQAIALLEQGDSASPFHLYCLAQTRLHRAFAQLLFGDYWSGYWNMRRAYLQFGENKKRFPLFVANTKSISLIQALTGILPSHFHWLVHLTGVDADLNKGMEALKKIIQQQHSNNWIFHEETLLTYGILLFYTATEKTEALALYRKYGFPKADNLLGMLTYINILLHTNQNEACRDIIIKLPQNEEYLHVPLIHYYKGLYLLQQLQPEAMSHFEQYIAQTQSPHFIKSAYHKIAWIYLLQGNEKKYREYLDKVIASGKTQREADRQAEREAQTTEQPHPDILKARLLFDGGYTQASIRVLNSINAEQLKAEKDRTELTYRKARAYQHLGEYERAISLYKQTITQGKELPYYFAANSALQLGLYYEKENRKEEAKKYYSLCLALKNHEYTYSISQKAKAGLERLK